MLEERLAVDVARLGLASLSWNLRFSHALPDPEREKGCSAVALAESKATYRNRSRRDYFLLLGMVNHMPITALS